MNSNQVIIRHAQVCAVYIRVFGRAWVYREWREEMQNLL